MESEISSGPSRAAGYVRVSRRLQREGHSPEVQRAGIVSCALSHSHDLLLMEEDAERGSKVTRAGYQRIMEAVRAEQIDAVIVYMFDRWGRDGIEWLLRARELDRLGVPIISVQEGRDEPGVMRYVRVGMAEQYSRDLARRVTPARRKAARGGTHMGRTPYGYRRVYPEREGGHRVQAGMLMPDEAEARVVRELYERYATGQWGYLALSQWLNADPTVPPPRGGPTWTIRAVAYILRNPTYRGVVRYDVKGVGLYERRAQGSSFEVMGQHAALVDEETWAAVQEQRERARKRRILVAPAGRPAVPLGYGVLVCADCGGPMVIRRHPLHRNRQDSYDCMRRVNGSSHSCRGRRYLAALAHEALLRELLRLEGRPWREVHGSDAAGGAPGACDKSEQARRRTREGLERALAQQRALLRRQAERLLLLDDVGSEERAAFRAVGAEIAARIAGLESQLGALGQPVADEQALRQTHRAVIALDVPALVHEARALGTLAPLRDVLLATMESAVIVERYPESRARWLRAEVTWSAHIRLLLERGDLTLRVPEAPH